MNIRILKFFCFLIAINSAPAIAKDLWWSYLSNYEDGPGSIRLNLALYESAPRVEFKEIVVTGITYSTTRSDGFPENQKIDEINAISEKVISKIQKSTNAIYVGTFTHNKEQLNYVYVSNSKGLEKILKNFYETECKGCKTYINIKADPEWAAYREFLYPNKEVISYYQKELNKLGFNPP